jgi:hypothetical protein
MNYVDVGRYRGMRIYGLSLDEYLNLEEVERSDTSHWWCISDNNHLLLGDMVIGKIENRMVELCDKRTNYKNVYYKQIKAKQVPQYKVVTERPTVEALAAEGEKKLAEAVKAAEANLLENLGTGEEKLAKVANEGVAKTTAIQTRARKQRRKSGGA